jgi:hypothetical protein
MDCAEGMEAVKGRKVVGKQSITITLPKYLVKAIEEFNNIDAGNTYCGKLAGLNAAAFIGEQLVSLFNATKAKV